MTPEFTTNNETMRMDHDTALRLEACSRYLAGELSPAETAAFEEHFFGCPQCAGDLTADAIFTENVRAVFLEQTGKRALVMPHPDRRPSASLQNRLIHAFALPLAAAACILMAVVIYQNAVQIPGLRTEMAVLSAPQPIPWVPLRLSREDKSAAIPKNSPFWMAYFRLPDPSGFPSYEVEIQSNGKTLKTVPLPAPPAGQPLSILLRHSEFPDGNYTFQVHGRNSSPVIASYTIDLTSN